MNSIVTVLTPAPSFDLTTLATAKQELGITTRTLDDKLSRWIEEASSTVVHYLGRGLASEGLQESFRLHWGSNNKSVVLTRFPVVSVQSVTADGTLLDPSEWEVNLREGLLYRLDAATGLYQIAWHCSQLVVVYTAGYALLGDLPRDIERACLILLNHRYAAGDRDPTIKSEDVPGILSTTYWVGGIGENAAVPPEAASLLNPFREMWV